MALINQRKSNKTTALADSYEYTNGGDMEMKTATDVLSDYSGKIQPVFIFINLSAVHGHLRYFIFSLKTIFLKFQRRVSCEQASS